MRRHIGAFATASAIVASFLFALSVIRSQHIPSAISDEEYGLYSAWTQSHFSKKPPQGQLYVLDRTFKFDPTEQTGGCRQPTVETVRVSASLTRQLADLGDAEYLFNGYPPANFRLPWKFALVDASPDLEPGTFHLVAFSRVAFNWNHTKALFAVSDACAGGECGRGGVVYAYKQEGRWLLKPTNCFWLY